MSKSSTITNPAHQSAVEEDARLPNIHPGEVLREEFLIPLRLSAYRLASAIHVPQTRISEIVNGQRAITADTAERLGRFFRTSARFWLNLQAEFDLEEIRLSKSDELAAIEPFSESRTSGRLRRSPLTPRATAR